MRRVLCGVVTTVGILSMVVVLAGCGAATSTARVIPTNTPAASATATRAGTISQAVAAACFGSEYASHYGLTLSGDFLMTPVTLSGHAYPSWMLPDGTPLTKPYQLHEDATTGIAPGPMANPILSEDSGGFTLGLCNTSATKTYTVTAVLATIAAFSPYSGQISQWDPCQGMMNSHRQLSPSGCGGGGMGFTRFHAVFQGDPTAGASVEMRQTGFDLKATGDDLGRLPLALAPREVVYFFLGMDKPEQAGSYAFTFGARLQTGETLTTTNSTTMLLAPVAHSWDGRSCNQSAFLSQITATDPETYYVCPVS